MAGKPCTPRKLTKANVREGFDSGAPELDEWLVRYSWQNQRANNAVTYVSVLDGRVVGYHAIAVANVTSEAAPAPVAKGAPRQVPCLLLARLAVDQSTQGFGLSRGLLIDAMKRTVGVADSVGVRALLVHARDDAARQFYLVWPSSWSRRQTRCTCCSRSRTSRGRCRRRPPPIRGAARRDRGKQRTLRGTGYPVRCVGDRLLVATSAPAERHSRSTRNCRAATHG